VAKKRKAAKKAAKTVMSGYSKKAKSKAGTVKTVVSKARSY
jgi:hypothetical protein